MLARPSFNASWSGLLSAAPRAPSKHAVPPVAGIALCSFYHTSSPQPPQLTSPSEETTNCNRPPTLYNLLAYTTTPPSTVTRPRLAIWTQHARKSHALNSKLAPATQEASRPNSIRIRWQFRDSTAYPRIVSRTRRFYDAAIVSLSESHHSLFPYTLIGPTCSFRIGWVP